MNKHPRAGEPYRPSNGTEGDYFEVRFCDRCMVREDCKLRMRAFLYEIGEPKYPVEWRYAANGDPTCTAFARIEDAR